MKGLIVINNFNNSKFLDIIKQLNFSSKGGGSLGYSYYHILIAGQSLAVGVDSVPIVSTAQNYHNLMFTGGVNAVITQLGSVTPLIATTGVDPVNSAQIDAESIANGVADSLSLLNSSNRFLVSDNGLNAAALSTINSGTTPYNKGISQITSGHALLSGSGYKGVFAICFLHGETDASLSNTGYGSGIITLQQNYQTNIASITNQTTFIPMFCYQQADYAPGYSSSVTGATAFEVLAAYQGNPTGIVLLGPNYNYPRVDGIHLFAHGYRSLGCQFAKIINQQLINKTQWIPLSISSTLRTGALITANFNVPVPPLVLDLNRVINPGQYGFSWSDSGGTITVSGVTIASPTSLTIQLSSDPSANINKFLRYAFHKSPASPAGDNSNYGLDGPVFGAAGNLRDSDTTPNTYGYDAFNWCCFFNQPVT